MGKRAQNAVRAGGGAIVGATVAVGVDLLVAMISLGYDPYDWVKPLALLYLGVPVAIVVGAVVGAIVGARPPAFNAVRASPRASPATRRRRHRISLVAGVTVSVVVGVGLVPVALALIVTTESCSAACSVIPLVSLLVWAAIAYSAVRIGRGAMRLVDRRIGPTSDVEPAAGVRD